jgi:hypothetical protein
METCQRSDLRSSTAWAISVATGLTRGLAFGQVRRNFFIFSPRWTDSFCYLAWPTKSANFRMKRTVRVAVVARSSANGLAAILVAEPLKVFDDETKMDLYGHPLSP